MTTLPRHADWYRSGAYAPYVRSHSVAGAIGTIIETAQPAGDFSDPPTSDLIVVQAVSNGIHQRSDFGAGRFEDHGRVGDMFLIPPETATDILVHNAHVIRCFGFSAATLRPRLEELRPDGDPFDFGRLHAGPFRNPDVLGWLDRLNAVALHGDAAGRLFADGAVFAIVAELMRQAERPPRLAVGGLAPWQVKRVTEYVEVHLDEDTSLADLAAIAGLSPYHFCRAFKQSTGLPPHRWRLARRVERARELLEATDLPVTEIAARVGYDDPTLLARAFRKALGASPSQYRRERRA